VPKFFRRNAAWIAAVVTAGVAMLTSFGLGLTANQVAAITAFVAAVCGVTIHVDATNGNGKNGHP
jgi:hypothetical protein